MDRRRRTPNAERRTTQCITLFVVHLCLLIAAPARADEAARAVDQGRLRYSDGLPVVTLRGSPYEIGYQHGTLLRDEVRAAVADTLAFARRHYLRVPLIGAWIVNRVLDVVADMERPHIPADDLVELQGVADGSGVRLQDLQRILAFADLSSSGCSSFVAFGRATADGRLLHGRNLDWNIQAGIQRHAVIFVVHPAGRERRSFVSVGYAGFIGVLTGINSRGISVAQIGAATADRTLRGMPMPLLLRQVLERAASLDEAIAIVRNAPRTVGYNYVFADAKRKLAGVLETTKTLCAAFAPNDPREASVAYAITVPDAVFRADTALDAAVRERQWASKGNPKQPGLEPPGGSAYEVRYRGQGERLREHVGALTTDDALAIMKAVAPPSNVQSVVFAYPDLWVANARDLAPAATQPYHHFNVRSLMGLTHRHPKRVMR